MKIKPDVNSLIHITSFNWKVPELLKQTDTEATNMVTMYTKDSLSEIRKYLVVFSNCKIIETAKCHKTGRPQKLLYTLYVHFFLCECLRYLFPFLLIIIHKAPFQMFQQYAFLLVFLSSLFRISFVPHVITTEVCSSKNHQYVY